MSFERKKEALELLKRGFRKKEIAQRLQISTRTLRRWFQELKTLEEEVESLAQQGIQSICPIPDTGNREDTGADKKPDSPEILARKQEYLNLLFKFRIEALERAEKLNGISQLGLTKTLQALEQINTSDLTSIRQIESFFKVAASASNLATDLQASGIAFDQVHRTLEQKGFISD